MKFILPQHQIKLHNEIHCTEKNCTTKCTNMVGYQDQAPLAKDLLIRELLLKIY